MYKIFCTLLILLITFPVVVESQIKSKTFKLDGEINSDSGTIILLPIGEDVYYPDQMKVYETKVMKNQFSISNPCLYPYAFKIGLKVNSEWVYISDVFWVEPGGQKILCNIDSSREVPVLSNLTMKELKGTYDTFELNSSEYDSIYAQFSTTIKNTYTGEVLARKLKAAKIARIGSVFPSLNLSDSKKQKVLTVSNSHNKFTLIDFWYSHCGPCIGQFEALKKLYSTYKTEGFSIIGISNENSKTIADWENVIKKHQLPWEQFLDLNGKECSNLSIYVFPSNFLLNDKGVIIAKHINTNDLSSFLEKNLK
ncbi:MAG: TlpA disulfide reductase family protein [Bacteroidota bacterium]|nr:TlpA disulfide reductase family protein [Bacteroidota bacterium]